MKEWSLIIFTLSMQAAIGTYLWATVVRFRDSQAPTFKKNTLVALILAAVGMLGSLTHLGKPFLAITSLANIGSSWLSREVFFSGGFFVLLLIVFLLERSEKSNAGTEKTLGVLTSLAGLAAIFAMAQIYIQTVIPAWQNINTVVDFYATALILGAVIFAVTGGKEGTERLPALGYIVLGVVFIQVALVPGSIATLGAAAGAGQESSALLAGAYSVLGIMKWLFILGGVFLFMLSYTKDSKANLLYVSVAVLGIGQLIGRYVFYSLGVPIGIGII